MLPAGSSAARPAPVSHGGAGGNRLTVTTHLSGLVSVVIAASLVLAGCAQDSGTPEGEPGSSAPQVVTLGAADRQQARRQLVAEAALPQLTPQARLIDQQDFVDEADVDGLQEQLVADGFRGGVERTFRGRSRQITGAESRVLAFTTAAGATSFADYLASNPDPFFGGPSVVSPLRVGDAEGALIVPPMCDCPGAYPLYVGVVADGERVLWLQLTGPEANRARLRTFLAATTSSG